MANILVVRLAVRMRCVIYICAMQRSSRYRVPVCCDQESKAFAVVVGGVDISFIIANQTDRPAQYILMVIYAIFFIEKGTAEQECIF